MRKMILSISRLHKKLNKTIAHLEAGNVVPALDILRETGEINLEADIDAIANAAQITATALLSNICAAAAILSFKSIQQPKALALATVHVRKCQLALDELLVTTHHWNAEN